MLKETASALVVGPLRANTNSPLVALPSIAYGLLVELTDTIGSVLVSLSVIMTVATLGDPRFAPGALVRVTTTVSESSTVGSFAGMTGTSTKVAPAGMVTE